MSRYQLLTAQYGSNWPILAGSGPKELISCEIESELDMELAKTSAGHWSDGGEGPGYDRRYEFIDDCVQSEKVAVSFRFKEGHPFDELSESDMKTITASELKEEFEKYGVDAGKAKNAADQITRFRDWSTPKPLFLYRGQNTIARMGYLIGPYEFNSEGFQNGKYDGYQHVRDVNWAEVPEEIPRDMLPEDLSTWIRNPQGVLDYEVEPRSEVADFLSLAWGLGFSMNELTRSQRRVLR